MNGKMLQRAGWRFMRWPACDNYPWYGSRINRRRTKRKEGRLWRREVD